jgi:hypothetical protein
MKAKANGPNERRNGQPKVGRDLRLATWACIIVGALLLGGYTLSQMTGNSSPRADRVASPGSLPSGSPGNLPPVSYGKQF